MKSVRFWAVLGLLALAGPGGPVRAGDDGKDRADLFPARQFQALSGKAVGVLVSGGQDVLAHEGRRGPADAFVFGSGPGSYRWVYVPVPKKPLIGGLLVRVGEKGTTTKPFRNLSMANAKTVEQWGITGPYALVEVEVNGGLGAPPGESFVATNMRPLDGTKEYPLQVTRVVGELRRQFGVYLKEQADAVEKGLSEARARVPADHKLTGGRERAETVLVTWLPETDHLRVTVHARIAEKALGPVRPGRPSLPTDDGPTPPVPASTSGLQVGVELGMTYEVSKYGVLDRSRPVPLHVFQKRFDAPAPRPPEESETESGK
jgi:hypothetical protein